MRARLNGRRIRNEADRYSLELLARRTESGIMAHKRSCFSEGIADAVGQLLFKIIRERAERLHHQSISIAVSRKAVFDAFGAFLRPALFTLTMRRYNKGEISRSACRDDLQTLPPL